MKEAEVGRVPVKSPAASPLRIHGEGQGSSEIEEVQQLLPASAARCAGRKPRLRGVFRAWMQRRLR